MAIAATPSSTSIALTCENLDEKNTEMFSKDIEKKADTGTIAVASPVESRQNLVATENYSVFIVK